MTSEVDKKQLKIAQQCSDKMFQAAVVLNEMDIGDIATIMDIVRDINREIFNRSTA